MDARRTRAMSSGASLIARIAIRAQSMRRALQDEKIPFVDVVLVAVDAERNNAVRVLLPAGADPDAARAALTKTITDLPLTTVNLCSGPAAQRVLTTQELRER